MGDRFDPGKESCYLQYLDANNLYGWSISRKLPTGRFKWVKNPDELKDNRLRKLGRVTFWKLTCPQVQQGLSPSGNLINMHKIVKIASVGFNSQLLANT